MELEARVCSCGCNRKLLRRDGLPDMSARRFFDGGCRGRDKRLRLKVARQMTQRRRGAFNQQIERAMEQRCRACARKAAVANG
jgi:hypothetical protein